MSNREKIRQFHERAAMGKRAANISGQLRKLIRRCADQRGRKTEDYVEEALQSLQRDGLIASFYMTRKWSRKDKQGVDAVIYLNDGTEVERQIKSSVSGVQKHMEIQEKLGGEVDAIYGVYLPQESFEEYKNRIFRSINITDDFFAGNAQG